MMSVEEATKERGRLSQKRHSKGRDGEEFCGQSYGERETVTYSGENLSYRWKYFKEKDQEKIVQIMKVAAKTDFCA